MQGTVPLEARTDQGEVKTTELITFSQSAVARTLAEIGLTLAETNHLVNAHINKRGQMRWSPRGAHRVLQVRAAVLDGRFGQQAIQLAAQRPRLLPLPILDAVGGLGAEELRLPITIYDPVRHFDEVRGRWYGTTPSP
jgi:hypothetical protein